ncbi:MAG: secretin N-terminal domain-containing protein [Verrucomicrobiota bacterium]|jgi:type II secretory pathway component GspD/PulD (secretin)
MKTLMLRTLVTLCVSGLLMSAAAQTAPGGTPNDNNAAVAPPPPEAIVPSPDEGAMNEPSATNQSVAPMAGIHPTTPEKPATAAVIPTVVQDSTLAPTIGTNFDELCLNFRNAPLEMVLNYLSDAAGFIIVMDTQVRGNVSVISSHPMTRNEAVDLLNSVLNKNGYAAIRDGRTLTILDKNDAKTRNIPVKTSNDPDSIPNNAEIVTQIIPIRFVEARQLVTDLSSFVSPQATIVANEAGNSIVVTDTQSNIRHLTEIIRAIDNSAEGETEIRVFHLTHASPADVASELSQIFPTSSGTSGSQVQSPFRFGGGPFGRFGGFGGGGGGAGGFGGFGGGGVGGNASGNNGQNTRIQKQTQVVAVADLRTSSVIVTASKDLMQEIAGMMEQLDVPSTRDQKVFVYHMDNGDPQQALAVLQNMFQNNNTTSRSGTSSSTTTSALGTRETQNATSGGTGSTTTSGTSTGIGGGTSRSAGGSAF